MRCKLDSTENLRSFEKYPTPPWIDLKLGPQTGFSAKFQSEGTIQLVPEPRKMAIIIARRWRGTWEGVPMATWCSEWIYRIGGGLVHHIVIIPSSLTLLLLRGAAVGRTPTILPIDRFCTRFSSFFLSPVFSAIRNADQNPRWSFHVFFLSFRKAHLKRDMNPGGGVSFD